MRPGQGLVGQGWDGQTALPAHSLSPTLINSRGLAVLAPEVKKWEAGKLTAEMCRDFEGGVSPASPQG